MRNRIFQPTSLSIIGLLFIVGACQKEKDNNPPQSCPINTSAIAGNYAFTSMKYKASANAVEQDYTQFMDACERDDNIFFSANGTYTYTDKGLTCSPNGNDSGTWSLNGNTITSDGDINGTIDKFDCKSLAFYVSDIFIPGDRMTVVLTRQ